MTASPYWRLSASRRTRPAMTLVVGDLLGRVAVERDRFPLVGVGKDAVAAQRARVVQDERPSSLRKAAGAAARSSPPAADLAAPSTGTFAF